MDTGKTYTKWLRKSEGSPLPGPSSDSRLRAEVHSLTGFLPAPAKLSPTALVLQELSRRIQAELEGQWPARFVRLNRSRRAEISRILHARTHGLPALEDAARERFWARETLENAARTTRARFLEEIAIVWIAKGLLLARWERVENQLELPEKTFQDLHYALHARLQEKRAFLQEGWNLAKQNIYSWFDRPSAELLQAARKTLTEAAATEDSASLLDELFQAGRIHAEPPAARGVDSRFLNLAFRWAEGTRKTRAGRESPGPVQAFTPSLRDGAAARSSPGSWKWSGCEASLLRLLLAEAHALWNGPREAPLWCAGSGLSLWTREQAEAPFVAGATQRVAERLGEMSAFDVAWVAEERAIPMNQRGPEAAELRAEAGKIPALEGLRAGGATWGALQAAVAVNKLRPGGVLLWARTEPLGVQEGPNVLGYLLGTCKLISEWDFSHVQHQLPGELLPFPARLYAFSRERDLETIRSHRPVRVTIRGSLRSHVEVPLLIEDALQAAQADVPPRAQWQVIRMESPTEQREWAAHWPEESDPATLDALAALKRSARALGEIAEVRESATLLPLPSPLIAALYVRVTAQGEHAGRSLEIRSTAFGDGSGHLRLTVPDSSWLGPLAVYLTSPIARAWCDATLPRKSGKWLLDEKAIRLLPLPRELLAALSDPSVWSAIPEAETEPARLLARAESASAPAELRRIAVIAGKLAWDAERELASLDGICGKDGGFRWHAILNLLSGSERVPLSPHPWVRRSGDAPNFTVLGDVVERKTPGGESAIQLLSEQGFHITLTFRDPLLREIAIEQIRAMRNPTWGEIQREVTLPRDPDVLKEAAAELLRSRERVRERREILFRAARACPTL